MNLDWQRDAICRDTDPETFFPTSPNAHSWAKRVCKGCNVKAQCLQYALDNHERWGVWGGMSETQRRKLLKGRAS